MVMTDDKRRFVDTNILITASDADRERHIDCRNLIESALAGQIGLFASGQIFREYLVVATRPIKNNGLAMQTRRALENVQAFKQCIKVLDENSRVSDRLTTLIQRYKLRGKRIHDANVAATMLEHGLKRLVTLNPGDFAVIKEIEVMEP